MVSYLDFFFKMPCILAYPETYYIYVSGLLRYMYWGWCAVANPCFCTFLVLLSVPKDCFFRIYTLKNWLTNWQVCLHEIQRGSPCLQKYPYHCAAPYCYTDTVCCKYLFTCRNVYILKLSQSLPLWLFWLILLIIVVKSDTTDASAIVKIIFF